jgi:hypothetical protein
VKYSAAQGMPARPMLVERQFSSSRARHKSLFASFSSEKEEFGLA